MGSISHTVVSSVSGLLFWQQHAANMLIFSPCSSRHKLNRDEVIHRKTREHLHITVYRCSELNIIYKCCTVTSLRVTWTMRDRSQHCRNNHFLLEWKWAWICNSRHRCLHAFKRTQPCKPGKMMLVSPYKVLSCCVNPFRSYAFFCYVPDNRGQFSSDITLRVGSPSHTAVFPVARRTNVVKLTNRYNVTASWSVTEKMIDRENPGGHQDLFQGVKPTAIS